MKGGGRDLVRTPRRS